MHAIVGIGTFIWMTARRSTFHDVCGEIRNMTAEIRKAANTGVPGAVSQANLKVADAVSCSFRPGGPSMA